MVDETVDNNVDKTQQQSEPEPKPETVQAKPEIDMETINAIKSEFEALKNKTAVLEDSTKKLNQIKEVFTGEDKQALNEKILMELAEDPLGTIEKYSQGKTAKELEEIKREIQQNKLKEYDKNILAYLKSTDPEYDNVFSQMGKYINESDFKKYENEPNRSEIWYGLTKTRMAADLANKKNEQNKANTAAKNIVNQTVNTEIPSSGGSGDEGLNDIDRRIAEARQQGKWNTGEGFTNLDADIFARFHRDVYGIKPKR